MQRWTNSAGLKRPFQNAAVQHYFTSLRAAAQLFSVAVMRQQGHAVYAEALT